MTARDEAIAAGNAAMMDRYGYEPVSGRPQDAYWVHALDAIPADVLARLAIERGGFGANGWTRGPWHESFWERQPPGDGWVRLYRVVES